MALQRKVLIVDPDDAQRSGYASMLAAHDVSCATHETAAELLSTLDADAGGCIVAEMRLPDACGLQLLSAVQARASTLPVVFVTHLSDARQAALALRQGAIHYLVKPASEAELWAAIDEALHVESAQRDRRRRRREFLEQLARLTSQERRVLELVVEGAPNKAIARELDVSVRTVEERRRTVFRTLGCGSVAALVRLVVELGGLELGGLELGGLDLGGLGGSERPPER